MNQWDKTNQLIRKEPKPLQTILKALLKEGCGPQQIKPGQWTAKCPCCNDSLSVSWQAGKPKITPQ